MPCGIFGKSLPPVGHRLDRLGPDADPRHDLLWAVGNDYRRCDSDRVSSPNSPTGVIQITDNGHLLSAIALSTGATSLTGTVTIPSAGNTYLPKIGVNTIVANYLGDANFGDSTQTATFTVNPDVTTTTMQTTVNPPSVYGQAVTVSATVANTTSTAAVTGWVDFYDNATTTSSGVYLGSAGFQHRHCPVDDQESSGRQRLDHRHVPRQRRFCFQHFDYPAGPDRQRGRHDHEHPSRPNPSTFGQTVTLVASVTANTPGGGRPGGTVAFEVVGGATLGTVNIGCGGTARFTTNTLAIGSYTIEAVFTPSNANFIASTSTTTVTQVVNQATPKVKLSTPPGSFPIAVGGSLTVTATVGAVGLRFRQRVRFRRQRFQHDDSAHRPGRVLPERRPRHAGQHAGRHPLAQLGTSDIHLHQSAARDRCPHRLLRRG